MTKRTAVLSSATGMLLAMFSSVIDAQITELDITTEADVHLVTDDTMPGPDRPCESALYVDPVKLFNGAQYADIEANLSVYETLMEVTGFAEQLAKLPDAVASSIEPMLLDATTMDLFEPIDIPYLKKAIPAAFSTETLYLAVLEQLRAELSVNAANQLVQFYSSPLGNRLREAETSNSILENADQFEHWYATAGVASLSEERQIAFLELEQAMQATRGAVEAMIGMQVAMQVSLTPALPEDQQRSPSDLLRAAQFQRPGLTEHYRQSSLATLSFVFQKQSLAELHQYSTLLNTETGQLYVVAVNNGLSRGLFCAAENLGQSIQALLTGRSGQGV